MKRPKTGGRQKGTPNKRTVKLRELLERLNFDPAEELVKELRKPLIPPAIVKEIPVLKRGKVTTEKIIGADHDSAFDRDRAKLLRDVLDFVYPRRKPVDSPAVPASPAAPLAPGDGMEKLSREQLLELAKEKKGPIQ